MLVIEKEYGDFDCFLCHIKTLKRQLIDNLNTFTKTEFEIIYQELQTLMNEIHTKRK